jgi:secreted trypsin-like serine protease
MRCPNRLVGIVSWVPVGCGYAEYPAVYTNVYLVKEWILYLCSAQIIPKEITKAPAIP